MDLKSKGKKSGKKKRSNVFGEDDQGKKKTKIKLTHVDEYQEEPEKKLVIEPETLRSSFFNGERPAKANTKDAKPKYGLITVNDENQQEDTSNGQEHINLKLPDEDSLPEITKKEEYEKVPVEEFGEALLRGMGWDGKEDERNGGDSPAPRLPFLGIGAKALPNHNNNGRNKEQEDSYMPVVKVDKKSGEKVT